MNIIQVTKVYNFDENVLNPLCFKCNKELSGFAIDKKELKKLPLNTLHRLIEYDLIFLNEIEEGIHLIYLCKYCLNWEKIK